MAIDTATLIGKFYTFRPRSEWPKLARQTIPEDPMYHRHPVIIISSTSTGMVNVVMCTSHPRLQKGISNYVPIGFDSPLVKVAPLWTAGGTLPKASWVQLDSKRTFNVEVLTPFGGYKLGRPSKKRLPILVEEYELKLGNQRVLPAPGKKAVKNEEARKLIAAKFQALKEEPASFGDSGQPSEIMEIKASLSGLKLGVAALEALCEKLESKAGSTSVTEISPSVATAELAVMSGALALNRNTAAPNVSTEWSGMAATKDRGCAASGLSSSTRSSKRSRIEKWFSSLWTKRTGLSLSSM